MNVFGSRLESACLSVHVSMIVSIHVQNTSVCQSTCGGIKSHLVMALVHSGMNFIIKSSKPCFID